MDQPPGWIKQSNAIPRHVAHKALRALVARLSAFDLPAVTSTQIHALTRPNEDTEGDAVAPGAWYLRVRPSLFFRTYLIEPWARLTISVPASIFLSCVLLDWPRAIVVISLVLLLTMCI